MKRKIVIRAGDVTITAVIKAKANPWMTRYQIEEVRMPWQIGSCQRWPISSGLECPSMP